MLQGRYHSSIVALSPGKPNLGKGGTLLQKPGLQTVAKTAPPKSKEKTDVRGWEMHGSSVGVKVESDLHCRPVRVVACMQNKNEMDTKEKYSEKFAVSLGIDGVRMRRGGLCVPR